MKGNPGLPGDPGSRGVPGKMVSPIHCMISL